MLAPRPVPWYNSPHLCHVGERKGRGGWRGGVADDPIPAGRRSTALWNEVSGPMRRYPRYEIETEVVYTLEQLPGPRAGQTARAVCARNLSQGGLLLEAGEPLPPGTQLHLRLLRGKPGAVEVSGEVVWAEESPPSFRHGVRILPLEPRQELAWKSFLDEAGREAGRRPLRYAIDLPVSCRRTETGEMVGRGALAVNISRGGLLVLLSVPVAVGTRLSLEVRTPTQSLKADARVARLEDQRSDGLIPHGLAFVDTRGGSQLLPQLFLLGIL